MTLSPQWLDELRARTTLSSVIAPSVKLVRAGREWKACCPFHNEKTPSFTVNDDKGFYHCFGCGAHGDAIRFLTDNRGMPFMDAVKELAAKAGMDVPAPDPRAQEQAERTASLTDVMAEVAKYYSDQLNGLGGANAREYLKRRGIDAATAQRFGLGLAPDNRTALKRALGKKLGEDRLIDTGMLIQPDEGEKESYDRFRGRLMIPIRDPRGRVIGFGGRILGDGEPKYLNSPQTVLFDKGRTLYNLDRAAPASRTAKRLIVVEGYMDVIALGRAGIAEVVAPNGTALTEGQLERLWRLDPSPILCFDGDNAGRKAAIRAATRALPLLRPDRTLRFVELPAGQDPDDVINAGGREAFEALLAAPEPLDGRLWRHELEAEHLGTPEAWAGLKERLIAHASVIGHADLARMYREDWLERFYQLRRPARARNTPFARAFAKTFKNGRWTPPDPPVGEQSRSIGRTGIDPRTARSLIVGFVNFPEALPDNAEQLAALPIDDPTVLKVRDDLVNQVYAGEELDREKLIPIFGTLGVASGTPSRGAMSFSFTRPDTNPDRARADLAAAIDTLMASDEVERALLEATERFKQNMSDEAYDEQQRLIAAQQTLRERLAQLAGTD
ncbi:MAG: DNA primase [Pseudomonadota bacterium]